MKAKPPKILLFVADEHEDLEWQHPKYCLCTAGTKESYKDKHGYLSTADATFKEIREDDFDTLVIPGGYTPDKLRKILKGIQRTSYLFIKKENILSKTQEPKVSKVHDI